MRKLLTSTGLAGLVVAATLGLAQAASAAGWSVSVGDTWGWHRPYWDRPYWDRPYWGWRPVVPVPEPIYVRPAPLYVPEPVYVPAPRSEPRLDYVLGELGSQASRIGADRADGRLSAGSYQALMAEDSNIRSQAIHAADVHRGLPDVPYYHIQSEVQGLSHDIARIAG